MQQTTEKSTTFKRGRRLGDNFVGLSDGETLLVKITGTKFETFTSKNHPDGIDYVEVELLEKSNEPAKLWVGGGLKYLIETQNLFGQAVEIVHAGKKSAMVEIEGRMTEKEVNQYEIYSLDLN